MNRDSMFHLPSACVWRLRTRRFVLSRPIVMGILNVTPDSFSDGGLHAAADEAVRFALELVDAGADIIDVGGESTRPGSDEVAVAEELARVLPVVEQLAARGVCVSIDTRHAEVARACLDAGAEIINDISGFADPAMVELAAESGAGVVTMHMAGEPRNMQADPRYDNPVAEVAAFLQASAARLEAAGVASECICIDPGPGFGKNIRHNLELLAGTPALASLGYPLLAAYSRKSTLGAVSGVATAAERVVPSASAAVLAYNGGARIFRVHDVAETVQALAVASNAAYAAASSASAVAGDGAFATLLPGERVLVALGSNMGDSVGNLVEATRCIDTIDGVTVIASSSIYRSEPAYYTEQETFANSAVWVQTTLEPAVLLDKLFEIEDDFHRRRIIANGPRTLDLDVLDYEGITSDDPHIILPHPRVLERDFTVTPILELVDAMETSFGRYVHPDAIHALGKPEGGDSDGGFRLADGARVTRDGIQYGRILETLLEASAVFPGER
ncbi:MAG: dihydropteroate synthase [Coriobacteriales bacterium]|jgi:dihydropteroate synthase